MRKHSDKYFLVSLRSFLLLPFLTGLLLLSNSAMGKDSTAKGGIHLAIKEVHPNNSPKGIYKNPDYFKNVPVAPKQTTTDTKVIQNTFIKIQTKYHSPEFNYKENYINRLSWWDRIVNRITGFLNSLIPNLNWTFNKILYYILIGLGLTALIYVIFKLTVSGKKISFKEENETDRNSPEWAEKRLTEIDLQIYLEKALSDKDFMLAIRYLHLINLKKLALSGQIDWDYQKTNHEFLRELKNEILRPDFEKTIRIYEYIWYGKFTIKESEFSSYEAVFSHFNREIA